MVVVLTDFGSTEGSAGHLRKAVELLTGRRPVMLDARHFYDGGQGRARLEDSALALRAPQAATVRPSVVIVYEIPPQDRHRFERFQALLERSSAVYLGGDAHAWRNATDKHRTVERFAETGVAQMDSELLEDPSDDDALSAFERLGGDVWARPATGFGGHDVFHITDPGQLRTAVTHFEGDRWLLSRDARNFDRSGRRHQFRVVVLGDRVLRICEHVQADLDAPCNESRGAVSTVLPLDALPPHLIELAIHATASLGLPFGGVDLVPQHGGRVFEVNVHPVLAGENGFHTIVIPYVRAHLIRPRAQAAPIADSIGAAVRAKGIHPYG
ncbi:ATP-grasp domain-containing protein [Nocardia seriolae]|uniref:ATP-grasp fold RimK-type domain-containing protein n=1 Tax=Nocardia seriolae TaxID=37332 RepID=A0A0B8NGS9_9NOCA|nr:hypothetical protein [Nocardia seriolae]APA98395.1 hypothetical protein NS506_04347 [Nocardia seriolae]MTJ64134.1 alpha-L-glutamate ligase [Nocardia seriolae]MTJ72901.1 alpha-L-glutamate ligase [Nocardia seriolae]MTJ88087.1 alpha-L-glutamate ligase [Nocardia seriolae]MTK42020.1 alpha-L-glutamate ligase [Nocardia seriolae]